VICEAFEMIDEKYLKLDAGTSELVTAINRPRGDFDFERFLTKLKGMKDIVIQSLFIQGDYDNTQPEAIRAWIRAIDQVRPREVQVYTIDRIPADPGVRKVSLRQLENTRR